MADWRDDVGFARLQTIAGTDVPSNLSGGFTQVEGLENELNYIPNTASTIYTGKTFMLKSGASSTSNHANTVATNYYSTASLLPGTTATTVDLYEANHWTGAGFLKPVTNAEPLVELRTIQNHSWIGSTGTTAGDEDLNRRLDYAIDRDGFISAVGQNNGSTNSMPKLMCQGYHSISVGLTNGNHTYGLTTIDGTGRIKPDIVAPSTKTSFSTPMVGSAAGVLYEKLSASPHSLTGADLPRSIKAILMASARKDTVTNWDNTTTRPLDDVYGAGELNIHNAYMVMNAGKKASGATQHAQIGWSAETVNTSSSNTYFFNIPTGADATPFCASITWHRIITDTDPSVNWSASVILADLNLQLHNATGTTIGSQITHSSSTVDNVEMIYQTSLPAGDYAIVVQNTSTTENTPYALAWHSLPSVAVASSTPQALELDGTNGIYTFTRTGNTTYPLHIPLSITGDAIAGTHYTSLPSSILIPAGQTSTTLEVDPITDDIAQGDRTVTTTIADDFALIDGNNSNIIIKDKPADEWRLNNFSTTELADSNISGDNADPDIDSIPNLLEYALNLDPKSVNGSPTSPAENNGFLSLAVTKNPNASDLTWTAEVTSDLSTWTGADIISNDQTTFEARDTVLKTAAEKRMIRIKVARP